MAYRLYPVTKTETICDDYKIKVNGEWATLDSARVSAIPYNRRWPGHQREIEQSETVNFLSLAIDGPVTLEIFPKESFSDVKVRPASANIKYEITENKTILVQLEKPQYFTVEPYGRNRALHIFADPMKDYGVDKNDTNVIYFGAGEHEVGMIELHEGQTLYLDEGAVVYACIKAFDVDNIRILGRGILDNSHNKEKILFEAHAEGNRSAINNAERIHTVQLEYCNNVEIDGITIRDSLVYNIRPVACKNLNIRNVKIIGCWRFNSDGIDMHNCEDVTIEDCFIRTFDDSICVKGFDCYYEGDVETAVQAAMHYNGGNYENFRNVRVRRCVVWNDWGRCLEIGAETRAEDICDIVFEDCDIIHVMHSVLEAQNVDYANVHDLVYRNIRIELDDNIPKPVIQRSDDQVYISDDPDYVPALLSSIVKYHYEYSAGGDRRGKNYDILFEDIYITGRQKPKFLFGGHTKEYNSSNITMRNIYHNGKKLTSADEYTLEVDETCENIVIE